MQRTLLTGVAAAVMLFVAPVPSGAAGVPRTAPFDFGAQCFERFASVAVSQLGTGTPYGCSTVPDPAALMGRLSVRTDSLNTRAGVNNGGLAYGGLANASAGPSYASAGVYTSSGVGGRLVASAVVDGFTQGTRLCLYVGWRGYPAQKMTCGTASPTVEIDTAIPNTDYQIEVRLMAPAADSTGVSYPCPPSGLATCTGGTTWSTAEQSGVTVREISYSWG